MKYDACEKDLALGALLGCIAGAAITIGVLALTASLKRWRRASRRTIPSGDDDGSSLMEDLVAHNWHGF
jgi:uncharacterized membrane protein YccC